MKRAVSFIAVAGLASAAAAQTGSLSITSSVVTIDPSGTASFTLSVWGDADFGTAIAGGGFSLSATGGDGVVADMVASVPDWATLGFQDNGHAGGGNYNGVIFGQLIFPPFIPPAADSMLGGGAVLLGIFEVALVADPGAFFIEWTLGGGVGPFVMEVFTDDGGAGTMTRLTEADITFGSVSVFVPAPSSVVLLGLGGLVVGRRRR